MGGGGHGGFEERLSELRHELRTPIGHIIGYAELIEEDLDEDGRRAYGHDLAAIIVAGQKMLALIDQHLGSSRKSGEDIDFDEVQFALRMNLNHIGGYAEILREEAVERGETQIAEDLDRVAAAERTVLARIEDMVAQLMPEGGGQQGKEGPGEEAGTGTTAETAETTADKAPATIAGIGGEILIVDDNAINRELLTRRLARGGYTSQAVASGNEALEVLESRRFDLVLLDYMMPGLSGLETLQAIKQNSRIRTTPVIMLSATDEADLMVRCILSGAEDYVAKPFNPVLLTARINSCLEKIRLRRNAARQIKVFISSPGDVIPERQTVKMVLGRLNEEFSGRALLLPIMWEEEPLLASDTFQAQIHPPRETEIYLGILWSRIGSPLPESIRQPDGTAYESGTAFEFEDALAGHRETGRPEMLLYIKGGAPQISLQDKSVVLDRLEQIDRLNAYREKVLIGEDGSYVAAFHAFEETEQFETMVEMHLRKLVQKILARRRKSTP